MGYRSVKQAWVQYLPMSLAFCDIVTVVGTCALAIALADRFGLALNLPFMGRGAAVVTPAIGLTWVAALGAVSAWDSRLVRSGTEFYVRAIRATLYAFGVVGLAGLAGDVRAVRPFVLFGLPLGLCLLVAERRLFRLGYTRTAPRRRVGIVGQKFDSTFSRINQDKTLNLDLSFSVPITEVSRLEGEVDRHQIDILVIGANHGMSFDEVRQVVWAMARRNIEVWFDSSVPYLWIGRGIPVPSALTTIFILDPIHLSLAQRAIKRALDISVGLIAIVVLLPVVGVALIVVYAFDGRPLIFTQTRIGLRGERFKLFKIRTMHNGEFDASQNRPSGALKSPMDARITRVGHFLRRWSIDEIPQLINVLMGSMSLVGPRPRLESEVSPSSASTRRLEAKPGLTGPWQTSGRADIPLNEAEAIDLAYVDGWTLLGDVAFLIRTVKVVLTRRGAY